MGRMVGTGTAPFLDTPYQWVEGIEPAAGRRAQRGSVDGERTCIALARLVHFEDVADRTFLPVRSYGYVLWRPPATHTVNSLS